MKTTLSIAVLVLAVACLGNDAALEWQRGGAPWRVATCNFAHYNRGHLVWDLIAFAGLGLACERRNRPAFHAALAASAIAIPLVVMTCTPLVSYRGLSGIAAALFALLVTLERKQWTVLLCAGAFGAKLAFELYTGNGVFAADLGPNVVAVPLAHLAGAVIGVACGLGIMARPTCVPSSPCSSP